MRVAIAALALLPHPPAAAQEFAVFVEAPAMVVQGQTYEVAVLARFLATDGTAPGEGGFGAFGLSLLAAAGPGGVDSVSAASFPRLTGDAAGTVAGSDLLDVAGSQVPEPYNLAFVHDNPVVLFTFEVTTRSDFLGEIVYSAAEDSDPGSPTLVYWPAADSPSTGVTSDDPGATLSLGAVTTRVVPAPAALPVLASGLALSRRRAR